MLSTTARRLALTTPRAWLRGSASGASPRLIFSLDRTAFVQRRPSFRPLSSAAVTSSSSNPTSVQEPQPSIGNSSLPRKEVLLKIDWILEGLAPNFMKVPLQPIFEELEQDVAFVDEVRGYKTKGVDQLGLHVTKIRTYFRYKSPYNKVSYNGSYLFEDDDYVAVLWGLETIDSNIFTYLPSFLTGKSNNPKIIEGTLVFTVAPTGKVVRIVNRETTEKDRKLAVEFGELKRAQHEQFDREDRRAAERALKEELEAEARDKYS